MGFQAGWFQKGFQPGCLKPPQPLIGDQAHHAAHLALPIFTATENSGGRRDCRARDGLVRTDGSHPLRANDNEIVEAAKRMGVEVQLPERDEMRLFCARVTRVHEGAPVFAMAS